MNDDFSNALREAGLSVTTPRLMILEALHATRHPLAPAELAAQLSARLDRSTTYRNLELLRRIGFVQDVPAGWKTLVELSDRFDAHHHHITCRQCGQVASLDDPKIEGQLDELARRAGYVLISHQVELRGVCEQCRAAE